MGSMARVLVADDEEDIRLLVTLAVRKARCTVVASVIWLPPLQLRGTDGLAPSFRIELDATKAMSLGVTVHSFRVRKLAAAPFVYP